MRRAAADLRHEPRSGTESNNGGLLCERLGITVIKQYSNHPCSASTVLADAMREEAQWMQLSQILWRTPLATKCRVTEYI
jgi:hypothetical protein